MTVQKVSESLRHASSLPKTTRKSYRRSKIEIKREMDQPHSPSAQLTRGPLLSSDDVAKGPPGTNVPMSVKFSPDGA